MSRYHPLLVTLHWVLAALILGALFIGSQVLAEIPNNAPEKLDSLRYHMIIGLVIGALMLVRLVTRFVTQKPPHAETGNVVMNSAARFAHVALYVIVILMVASGIGISLTVGLPDIVFGDSGAALPETFSGIVPRRIHGILSKLLALTILVHIVGWAYHQFILKDGLIRRIWYGDRQ